ncbi:MAG: cysteine--tRNA ligase [Gammaproteobacteria bacterium]|nr:cysteine--tRNA ligase [Gammaproteobacteria bacterium]
MKPPVHLYNTLGRKKEVLRTEHRDRVTMYVCGPTVYNYAHIGNARPAVVFDVLARLLRHDYEHVLYARNFTDVDDKINAAAAAAELPIENITNRFIDAYQQDMDALGVVPPDLEPRVTAHIPDIVDVIGALIARGHAYEAGSHVLFDVKSFPGYGRLSGRRLEDMLAGARVEIAPYKRDPLDFVLWKPSSAALPDWDSPWGRGRPGWHIECSAMIGKHFGTTIDIHGGGQDLIFPHHENEIAQGTCAHDGRLYCRTWVHNGFVTVDSEKMSKSLGNILLVRDLLQVAPGEAIRFALLSTHYRRSLDWSDSRLEQAQRTLGRWYSSLSRVERDGFAEGPQHPPDTVVLEALRDDLNVSVAIRRLHQLCHALEQARSARDAQETADSFRASAALLGILQRPPSEALMEWAVADQVARSPGLTSEWVAEILAERDVARAERDFVRADELRQRLEKAGVLIEDRPEGARWRFAKEEWA